MTDIVDRANELAEKFQSKSLADHKEAHKPKFPYVKKEEPFECHECGVIVPVLRRELTGSELCIDCKNDLDDRLSKGGVR